MYLFAILHLPSSNGSSVINKKIQSWKKNSEWLSSCYITFYKIITLKNYVSKVSSYVPFQDLKSSGVRDDIV